MSSRNATHFALYLWSCDENAVCSGGVYMVEILLVCACLRWRQILESNEQKGGTPALNLE